MFLVLSMPILKIFFYPTTVKAMNLKNMYTYLILQCNTTHRKSWYGSLLHTSDITGIRV